MTVKLFTNSDIAQKLANYKLPRYEQLTPYPVAMRQLIAILNDMLSIFYIPTEEQIITPSMINSYVRKKVIKAPENKDYNKNQIIHLFALSLLKQVLTISEIGKIIEMQIKQYPIDVAYNYFCEELEEALKVTFDIKSLREYKHTPSKITPLTESVHSAVIAFANIIYVKQSIYFAENN